MKSFVKRISGYWSATDFIVVVFYILMSVLNIIFYSKLEYPLLFIAVNIVVIAYTVIISYLDKRKESKLIRGLRYWYLPPMILLTFKELYFMIRPIRGVDYDDLLIAIDRWIFGVDPTYWFMKISNPFFTEILQIAYASFFFLPMFLAANFYFKNRKLIAEYAIFSVIYGFFISYLGYFIFPGVGPRFTLHDFALLDSELPGLLFTPFIRGIINAGGSVFPWTEDPTQFVQRDVFPSGHTMMTLIVMYLSFKYRSGIKWVLSLFGTLLIISTVYLRYHYAIDVIAGFGFMILSVWSGKIVFFWWMGLVTNKSEVRQTPLPKGQGGNE